MRKFIIPVLYFSCIGMCAAFDFFDDDYAWLQPPTTHRAPKTVVQDVQDDLVSMTTPMISHLPAGLTRIHVQTGQRVKKGDLLFETDSMKMIISHRAPMGGFVGEIMVQEGET